MAGVSIDGDGGTHHQFGVLRLLTILGWDLGGLYMIGICLVKMTEEIRKDHSKALRMSSVSSTKPYTFASNTFLHFSQPNYLTAISFCTVIL